MSSPPTLFKLGPGIILLMPAPRSSCTGPDENVDYLVDDQPGSPTRRSAQVLPLFSGSKRRRLGAPNE
jgi:hypothetical protein